MSIDLSLDRITKLASCFPPFSRPTVHIAGTNGKGSTSAFLTHVFLATNPPLSVGRFNSPHLVNILDCITVNDCPVALDVYESARQDVQAMENAASIGASNFELLTVTALLIFERAQVDIVVCEVGMGGRLDATNVIPDGAIIASVITSVDLDHQAFLGSSVASIAREKAGIIRQGKPVILSPQKHADVQCVVEDVASSFQAPLKLAPLAVDRPWDESFDGLLPEPFSLVPFTPPPPRPVMVLTSEAPMRLLLPLHGDHQLGNLSTAITALSSLRKTAPEPLRARLSALDENSIMHAIRNCTWPGRLSFHSFTPQRTTNPPEAGAITVLVDGAHNQASAETLGEYITSLLHPIFRKETVLSTTQRKLSLTYILALSHSPPKTAPDVLTPLLGPSLDFSSVHDISVNIALLRFTPPDGMPWVKSIPPSHLANVARALHPEATVYVASDDAAAENQITDALEWAGERGRRVGGDNLIVVAGSLYLVADFYRVLTHGT